MNVATVLECSACGRAYELHLAHAIASGRASSRFAYFKAYPRKCKGDPQVRELDDGRPMVVEVTSDATEADLTEIYAEAAS